MNVLVDAISKVVWFPWLLVYMGVNPKTLPLFFIVVAVMMLLELVILMFFMNGQSTHSLPLLSATISKILLSVFNPHSLHTTKKYSH